MAVLQNNTFLNHDGNAGFQAWATEFRDSLLAVGLIQTGDSGQMNPSTAVRPGVNAYAGYMIFRLNDSHQNATPVFMRFQLGTAGSNSAPRIAVQIGTGTDGSGNLTGQTTSVQLLSSNGIPAINTNFLSSYSCSEGYFAFLWKGGAQSISPNYAFFCVCRSAGNDGLPTSDAVTAYFRLGISQNGYITQTFQRSTLNWTPTTGNYCAILAMDANQPTFIGADAQVFLHYGREPRIRPLFGNLTVKKLEFGEDSTFTATPIGTLQRTYLNLGSFAQFAATNGTSDWSMAILWE